MSVRDLRNNHLHNTMQATSHGKLVKSATLGLWLDVDHEPMCDDECAFEVCDYDACFEFGRIDQTLGLQHCMRILRKFANLQSLSMEIDHMIKDPGGDLVFDESCIELPSLQELRQLPFNSTIQSVQLISEADIHTAVADHLVAWTRELPQLSSLKIKRLQFPNLFSSSFSFATNLTSIYLEVIEHEEGDSSMAEFLAFLSTKNHVRRMELGLTRWNDWDYLPQLSEGLSGIADLTLWTLPPLQPFQNIQAFWSSIFCHLDACTTLYLHFGRGRRATKEEFWNDFISNFTANTALCRQLINLTLSLSLHPADFSADLAPFLDNTRFPALALLSVTFACHSTAFPARLRPTAINGEEQEEEPNYVYARKILVKDFRSLLVYPNRPAVVSLKYKAFRPDYLLRLVMTADGTIKGHMNGMNLSWTEDGQMVSFIVNCRDPLLISKAGRDSVG